MNALFATQIAAISNLKEVTPSQHSAFSYIGDARSEIGLKLCNNYGPDTKFKLIVAAPEIMDESVLEGVLDTEFRTYELFPPLMYRLADLNKIRQPRPISVDFRLYINGQLVFSKRENPTFYPYSMVPTHFEHRRGTSQILTEALAACVNEFNPAIQQRIVPQLETEWPFKSGYYDKAAGIYAALQEQGIKYACNIVSDKTGATSFQEYKTPDRVLLEKSGNCFDLSILFASALKKCGIPAYIITRPGHAQVGFTTESGIFYLVEATQIDNQTNMEGLAKFPGFAELEKANKAFLEQRKEKLTKKQYLSYARFMYYAKETSLYSLILEQGTTVIPIDQYRTEGVRPTMYTPTK
jgi:hypothetical protein